MEAVLAAEDAEPEVTAREVARPVLEAEAAVALVLYNI